MNWKPSLLLLAALFVPSGRILAVEQGFPANADESAPAFIERMTDDQLRALQKAKVPAATATPDKAAHEAFDVMEMSDFIAFDGFSTLVPKGAILNVPAPLRSGMAKGPTGRLLIWNEFLTRNRARVVPFEISIEQAVGKTPIDPKSLETAIHSGMIVVAVIHGSPTSVIAPASPPPATASSR